MSQECVLVGNEVVNAAHLLAASSVPNWWSHVHDHACSAGPGGDRMLARVRSWVVSRQEACPTLCLAKSGEGAVTVAPQKIKSARQKVEPAHAVAEKGARPQHYS